ncbi:MAG: hypothetical protein IPG25_10045 [Proteobacteria bacterium]|nr:hypothetical protein [Pseudomonadota bacterium]
MVVLRSLFPLSGRADQPKLWLEFVVCAIAVVGCSENVNPTPPPLLRELVVSAGPSGAQRVLDQFNLDGTSVSILNDRDFLIEIWNGQVETPEWLSPKQALYSNIRSTAGTKLALAQHNRIFLVPDPILITIREFARQQLLEKRPLLENYSLLQDPSEQTAITNAVLALGAVGAVADTSLLEETALVIADDHILQDILTALAVSCEDEASESIDRVIAARRNDLTIKLIAELRVYRTTHLRSMCTNSGTGIEPPS